MVSQVDERIAAQLQRTAMIDKTEKRLDQLNYLLGDINMKIHSLGNDQKTVADLSVQLASIAAQSLEAKAMMERLSVQKTELLAEEQRVRDLRKNLEGLLDQARAALEDFSRNVEFTERAAAECRGRFDAQIETGTTQIAAVEKHRADIAAAEQRLSGAQKALDGLKAEMEQIGRRTAKIEAIDGRLGSIDTAISDMEIRVETIDKSRDLVNATQKKVDGLTALMAQAVAQTDKMATRSAEIEKVEKQVVGMEEAMKSLEHRARDLSRERQAIADAEKQINSLSLLVEDIKAQLSNVKAEEQRIRDAVEKTAELRFLLGEVESKLGLFKREKERLEE